MKYLFAAAAVFLALFDSLECADVVLARSGTNSRITYPGPSHSATLSTYKYPTDISSLNGAQWIWDGAGWNVPCPLEIGVEARFNLKCPGEDIHLKITADNRYTYKLAGSSGSGSDWRKIDEYTIPTKGYKCNQPLTLAITAKNDGSNCNGGNPAALIYYAYTEDCTTKCKRNEFWNNQKCKCEKCSDYEIGCLACRDANTCTACDESKGWVLSKGQCICKTKYYLVAGNDSMAKSCLPCGRNDKRPECM